MRITPARWPSPSPSWRWADQQPGRSPSTCTPPPRSTRRRRGICRTCARRTPVRASATRATSATPSLKYPELADAPGPDRIACEGGVDRATPASTGRASRSAPAWRISGHGRTGGVQQPPSCPPSANRRLTHRTRGRRDRRPLERCTTSTAAEPARHVALRRPSEARRVGVAQRWSSRSSVRWRCAPTVVRWRSAARSRARCWRCCCCTPTSR